MVQSIIESGKKRQQTFEGRLIKVKNDQINKSFTVRKISSGQVGVERIWPLNSPNIINIKMIKAGQIKKAKLYHLRQQIGKQAVALKVRKPKRMKIKATS